MGSFIQHARLIPRYDPNGSETQMKRAILAVSLCLLLVGTIGTAAASTVAVPITGKSTGSSYDVLGPNGKVCGKIVIDTSSGRFFSNCYGLTPGKEWKLVYHVTGLTGSAFIKSGVASPCGAVHLMGSLDHSQLALLNRPGQFSVVLYVP
jgi:hypothetical protein